MKKLSAQDSFIGKKWKGNQEKNHKKVGNFLDLDLEPERINDGNIAD